MHFATGAQARARWIGGFAVVALLAGCQATAEVQQPSAVPPSPLPTPQVAPGCMEYLQFTSAPDTTVTMLTAIDTDERQRLSQAWSQFESCTGIRITFETTEDVETALIDRVVHQGGPDLVILPSPHLIPELADRGLLKPAPPQTVSHVNQLWQPIWADYGSHEQTLFAAPFDAQVSSLVWYSPTRFAEWQIDVPTTWDGMLDLSDRLAESGTKPWCGGLDAPGESGVPATTWLSEIMLRLYGGAVYDRWIDHEVTFLSPQVIGAMQVLEYWLRNPAYVNGGFGEAESIATTPVQSVGQAVLDGECAMWLQGSDQTPLWQLSNPTIDVSDAGDVFAFVLPGLGSDVLHPVIGSGHFIAALTDRDEVIQVRNYLSSARFAEARAALGDWVSANSAVPSTTYSNPVDQLAAATLTRPEGVFRITGADLMPTQVARSAFPQQMTAWFAATQGTEDALATIDAAWPED